MSELQSAWTFESIQPISKAAEFRKQKNFMSAAKLHTEPKQFGEMEQVLLHQKRDFSFEKVIDMPLTRAALSQFCHTQNVEEVFEFYDKVDQYRNKRCEEIMKQMAHDLYETYVRNDAPKEINICNSIRLKIHRQIEDTSLWEGLNSRQEASKIFDEAQFHAFLLLKSDIFPRFLRSKHFSHVLEDHHKDALFMKISRKKSSINILQQNADDLIPSDLGKLGATVTDKDFQFFSKLMEDSVFHWDILNQSKDNVIFVSKRPYTLKDHSHDKECVPCRLYKYTGTLHITVDAILAICADYINLGKKDPLCDQMEEIGFINGDNTTGQNASSIIRETTKPLPFVKPRELVYASTMKRVGNRVMHILKSIQTEDTALSKKAKRGCIYSCLSAEQLTESSIRYNHVVYIDLRISANNSAKFSQFCKFVDEQVGIIKGKLIHKIEKEFGGKMQKKLNEDPQAFDELKQNSTLYQSYVINNALFN